MDNQQTKFEGWAIVEMMGHQKEIGYVTTEAYGVAVLFRVDTPDIPPHEYTLRRPEYGRVGDHEECYLPVGTKVKREGSPAKSRMVSPAALYAMNPCTEEVAREAIARASLRPLICLEMPAEITRRLPAPSEEAAGAPADEEAESPDDGSTDEGDDPEDTPEGMPS